MYEDIPRSRYSHILAEQLRPHVQALFFKPSTFLPVTTTPMTPKAKIYSAAFNKPGRVYVVTDDIANAARIAQDSLGELGDRKCLLVEQDMMEGARVIVDPRMTERGAEVGS